MAYIIRAMKNATEKYPILRGMVTYSVLWPASNFVQQSMDKTREKYDPVESLRYLFLGSFVTAPTVYVWVKLASKIIKGTSLKHALLKVSNGDVYRSSILLYYSLLILFLMLELYVYWRFMYDYNVQLKNIISYHNHVYFYYMKWCYWQDFSEITRDTRGNSTLQDF